MSIISKGAGGEGAGGEGAGVNFQAIEKIKKWLIATIDKEDLNIPIKIGSLARKTRKIDLITERGNQPFFQQFILSELEKEGYCKINPEKKEVTFLKLFN
jgi:hypothetical protein